MKNLIETISFNRILFLKTLYFGVFLGIVFFAPFSGHQLIAGSLVNAALFISTALLGVQAAFLVAAVPSLAALATGLLPAVLAPMIPFIIIGNIILVSTFNCFKKNYWFASISASLFKFSFLFLTSSAAANLIIKKEAALSAAVMIGWPQLLTAISGALIAFLFLKKLKNFTII